MDRVRTHWETCEESHHECALAKLRDCRAERDALKVTLLRKGYRESCDIPACNCGDQWNHGGHAEDRLHEIAEAVGWPNGKTVLGHVLEIVAERDALRGQLGRVTQESQAWRDGKEWVQAERDRLRALLVRVRDDEWIHDGTRLAADIDAAICGAMTKGVEGDA